MPTGTHMCLLTQSVQIGECLVTYPYIAGSFTIARSVALVILRPRLAERAGEWLPSFHYFIRSQVYLQYIKALRMDKKLNGTTILNEQDKDLSNRFIIDSSAPLSVLNFSAGTLKVDLPDCIKRPGIYGTLFQPIEFLDSLFVENGVNKSSVRVAGQFKCSQNDIYEYIQKGYKIELKEDLTIVILP